MKIFKYDTSGNNHNFNSLSSHECNNSTETKYNTKISTKKQVRIYGLNKNETYFFRVSAKNYAGSGGKSDPVGLDYHLYNPPVDQTFAVESSINTPKTYDQKKFSPSLLKFLILKQECVIYGIGTWSI